MANKNKRKDKRYHIVSKGGILNFIDMRNKDMSGGFLIPNNVDGRKVAKELLKL